MLFLKIILSAGLRDSAWWDTANPSTKLIPTKIRWLKISGKFPMDMIISIP